MIYCYANILELSNCGLNCKVAVLRIYSDVQLYFVKISMSEGATHLRTHAQHYQSH